jgi:site-specific recombinase XerD
MDLEQHLQDFLAQIAAGAEQPRTRDNYEEVLIDAVQRAPRWTATELQIVVTTTKHGRPYAASTRNMRVGVLRRFSAYLLQQNVLDEDAASGLRWVPLPEPSEACLRPEDIARMLHENRRRRESWYRWRDEVLLLLPFYTGLRVGEMISIDLDQVILSHRLIRAVRRKGGKKVVDFPLHPVVASSLETYLAGRPETHEGALFLNATRLTRLSTRSVQRLYARCGSDAGLELPHSPHQGRHSHASTLLSIGTSLDTVQRSMNHSSIKTTQLYLHGGEVRRAVDQLPHVVATDDN